MRVYIRKCKPSPAHVRRVNAPLLQRATQ
jgi:hypothetical protein